MAPPITVILNCAAGTAEARAQELRDRLINVFRAHGAEARVSLVHSGAEILEVARCASQERFGVVVAAGGDGTISSVASVLARTGTPMGVLPLGTLNHFAKDLKIPLDIEEAARVILAGHTTEVDVGEVNGHIFVNNSSLGLYPAIVRERQRLQRMGRGKWPAFAWAAAQALRRYPFLFVRLHVEGIEITRRTPFVFIGNNEYNMEGFRIGSRDALNRGELSLYLTRQIGRAGLLLLSLNAILGLKSARSFDALKAQEFWIETPPRRMRIALDGEVVTIEPPLHYRVQPRALRVIVPSG